ncbi:hypothetical protein DPMN_044017 [Dreissena polymorpha]|uniref:Uncharacterized protein n=1 Tax=Dreissena polymorpha TaxID=45954 RepID=A0A9D4HYC7_DREPO|nr:hypothetical protein DPMN_044017 [Dreissena polymorpha]
MSNSARETLAFNWGKHEAQAVSDDINCISSSYRDLDHLLSLNADVYLRKRNKVVLSFLDGISSDKNNQNSLHKCLAIEHVYQLTCSNLVTPYSFVLNLMQYQATQSKLCINLNSKVHPCGAYKTVNNWLTNHGSIPLPFPKDNCIVVFDNDQIIGKSWYIKADNKVNASIVTSFCAVEFNSRLQFDKSLHPKVWFKYSDYKEKLAEIRNREGDVYSSVYDLHYMTVQTQLNDVIQNVYTEQKSSYQNGVFTDTIDKSALEMSHKDSITCVKCSTVYKKSKIKCDNCHANIRECNKRTIQEESTSFQNEHAQKKINITEKEFLFQKKTQNDSRVSHETDSTFQFRVLDPAALNPNSYDSVKLVLRKVGVEAGVET